MAKQQARKDELKKPPASVEANIEAKKKENEDKEKSAASEAANKNMKEIVEKSVNEMKAA